ncbi:MAG TPA: hypothetical protein VIM30_11670 [Candidatus Limnocylindrales bacterium]
MVFDFLRRPDAAEAESEPPPGARSARFEAVTDEWRIVGRVELEGRLSDLANRREPIQISDVSSVALEGSAGPTEAASPTEAADASEPTGPTHAAEANVPTGPTEAIPSGEIDPYDLILMLAGPDTLPVQSSEERIAHRVHKIAFNLSLAVPPFRVVGTVYLFPGTEPDQLLDRGRDMFVPVVRAVAYRGEEVFAAGPIDAILVNRFYLRGVEQVDSESGAPIVPMPG